MKSPVGTGPPPRSDQIPQELIRTVERIGLEVAAPAAADVDARARFPEESISALKQAGVLSAAVPRALGGAGASPEDLATMCTALGQHCASSAMILAMHHIQVASIARHCGAAPEWATYLRRLVDEQRLIASVTSEVGPGGDLRQSVTCVTPTGDGGFTLSKKATTISYGAYAEDLLVTARRDPEAAPSNQVLVLVLGGDFTLEDPGTWDTLGMRGTCSAGARVEAKGKLWQVLPQPFAEIATETMVPMSHVTWGACWLGIATDAAGKARAVVRSKARSQPGVTPPAARRLSGLMTKLQLLRSEVFLAARDYGELIARGGAEELASMAFVLRLNNLKLSASQLTVEVVSEALFACGIGSYMTKSPFSLSRQLRDAFSAPLMINNDRIHETNASILSVFKGE